MPRLKSLNGTVKSAWHEYGGWVVLLVTIYGLFSFRKVFSSLGDAAGDTVGAAVANAQASAQTKAEKAKVQQATGTKTNYTDLQLANFRADAATLAGFFGTLSGGGWTQMFQFANQEDAFALLKQKYPRLRLMNNKPCVVVKRNANGTAQYKNQVPETAACEKMAVNYKVLIPYYKEVTGGRDLVTDIRKCIISPDRVAMLKWIL